MIDTYFWKIKYWNDDSIDAPKVCCGTVGAESYGDAVCKVEKRFGGHSNINEIVIYESDFCDGFTFFEENEKLWNHLLKSHKGF